ncbi:MAG: methyltransferase domain-containing protein [Clostridia bacterium]|nr:methyltransferase domain-containing protein [Clostridia bacterium]
MIAPSYSVLASCYDTLMEDVDYAAWADFYEAQFARFADKKPQAVLDLGCGTGVLTNMLADRGYDMIGVDLSSEMLAHASTAALAAQKNVLYLEQDMRSFDLFGTVDAVVCSLDGINYLTKKEDVARCFERVHLFLNDGGLFLFDVNTPWKFEHIFGDESYILENETTYLGWQNQYNKKTGLCRFYLTFFCETESGLWERFEEVQSERSYSDRVLRGLLEQAGFDVLDIVSDFAGTPAGKEDERHYFICKKR